MGSLYSVKSIVSSMEKDNRNEDQKQAEDHSLLKSYRRDLVECLVVTMVIVRALEREQNAFGSCSPVSLDNRKCHSLDKGGGESARGNKGGTSGIENLMIFATLNSPKLSSGPSNPFGAGNGGGDLYSGGRATSPRMDTSGFTDTS